MKLVIGVLKMVNGVVFYLLVLKAKLVVGLVA